ncbi:holliday junction DNA helicase RuvA [Chlamydia ibidis]|uniref:Holliday junction branch migration complex subunit RuvA n=2 Tax=Chlamydia ibidis TaxID=1405396 RepID=S7J397_9CHLA|nr:Holliday junction branch migration protein RuvA [Chlamydia ibidis]EPP34879.1 holliday junction DNA helicase RuvA [Chlamydia ibidis]EQM63227.1 Holliday junction DNA helicase RuvA [Chlamydia ibidis 10-1398/6]
MYDYIRGNLVYVSASTIVLECQGIGFSISITERWLAELSSQLQSNILSYTHTIVRETEHTLYGFPSRGERECFRILISFAGIGPKTGLAILNRFPLAELCVIARSENIKAIASVPGIGKKTAEKLMVDLKQKLADLLPLDSTTSSPTLSKFSSSVLDEGVKALSALGYTKTIAERMLAEAIREFPGYTSLSEILPLALKKNLQTTNKS